MKPRVIFGIGKIADVVYYHFREESSEEVVAFTTDQQYLEGVSTFHGLPTVPFEEITEHYPPNSYDLFVAVGYQDMNGLRSQKVKEAKEKGYELVSYVHPDAPKDLTYGYNCFIMRQACIHPCVELGNNVFVWSGAMIGHHAIIGSDTWITSSANIGGNVTLGEACFVAMNATIGHSLQIGSRVFLGANTLVTKELEDEKVVITESHKPIRLNSQQFLRMSTFQSL